MFMSTQQAPASRRRMHGHTPIALSCFHLIAVGIICKIEQLMSRIRRSLFCADSYLVQYVQDKDWVQVNARLRNYPKEAVPTKSIIAGARPSVLALAIRCGAPLRTIVDLAEASPEQLLHVKHDQHGTILHEVIKWRASYVVILHLIDIIIEYQEKEKNADGRFFSKSNSFCKNIFDETDSLGRTALHYLVERVSAGKDYSDDAMLAVQKLVDSSNEAAVKKDHDGYNPLDLALSSPNYSNIMEVEMIIYSLCPILLAHIFPGKKINLEASFLYESPKRQSRALVLTNSKLAHNPGNGCGLSESTIAADVQHNLISLALLYRRHISIIECIMEAVKASHTVGDTHFCKNACYQHEHIASELEKYCMEIVSSHLEVPLHIAVTMKANSDVVQKILSLAPTSAIMEDICGLSPICWTWIQHVIDVKDESSSVGGEIKSLRRNIPFNFVNMSKRYTEELSVSVKSKRGLFALKNAEERRVWQKLNILLPTAAEAVAMRDRTKTTIIPKLWKIDRWSPLHAATFLNCPHAVVLIAITGCHDDVRKRDSLGNIPLHFAAACRGYSKVLQVGPVGAEISYSETPLDLVEDLVALYPEGAVLANKFGQLPLHIAIQSDNNVTESTSGHSDIVINDFQSRLTILEKKKRLIETSTVLYLSRVSPETLEIRDESTGLYPFILAAAGSSSWCLDTTYLLLRQCPSLV